MFNAVEKGFLASGDADTEFLQGAHIELGLHNLINPFPRGSIQKGSNGQGLFSTRTVLEN